MQINRGGRAGRIKEQRIECDAEQVLTRGCLPIQESQPIGGRIQPGESTGAIGQEIVAI